MIRTSSILPAMAVLAALMPAAASAQGGLQWVNRDGEEGPILAYEVPNSSDQLLYLGCDKTGSARLSAQFDVKGLGPDKPVTLTFSGGGKSVDVKAKTETDEMFPYAYPVAASFDPRPLLALLGAPGEVVARAHKGTAKFTDRGRAKAVQAFGAKCPSR